MARPLLSRPAAGALLSLLILASAAPTAAARPDPGDTGAVPIDLHRRCQLIRIDRQLVRCDDLTGAGVPAPLFIPELGPVAAPGSR
jgi:hypothetical protein